MLLYLFGNSNTADILLGAAMLLWSAWVIWSLCKKQRRERGNNVSAGIGRGNEPKQSSRKASEDAQNLTHKTKALVLDTLKTLNCEVEADEDFDFRLNFSFQGQNFSIDTSEDCLFINIWSFGWGYVDLDDLDEMSRLRRAINDANIQSTISNFYSINTDDNKFVVHSKRNTIFVPELPRPADYLTSLLTDFFHVQRNMAAELEKLRNEENAESGK